MQRDPISVCIAAFNGSKYIENQIHSIISQLESFDEVIVVDDLSEDETVSVVQAFGDKRVKCYINDRNLGVVATFEKAITLAQNSIVFLSDQDDEWVEGKVEIVLEQLHQLDSDMIIHDGVIVDEAGNEIYDSIYSIRNSGSGILKNFIKDTHMGSCMAFKNDMKKDLLPIPKKIGPAHDLWLGLFAEIMGYKVDFIPHKLLLWKRHNANASSFHRRKLHTIATNRIFIFFNIIGALISKRILKKRVNE